MTMMATGKTKLFFFFSVRERKTTVPNKLFGNTPTLLQFLSLKADQVLLSKISKAKMMILMMATGKTRLNISLIIKMSKKKLKLLRNSGQSFNETYGEGLT